VLGAYYIAAPASANAVIEPASSTQPSAGRLGLGMHHMAHHCRLSVLQSTMTLSADMEYRQLTENI